MPMTKTEVLSSCQVLYVRLHDSLPDLLRRLRNKGYKPGLDQYLSAQTLFCLWRKQPDFSKEQIRASLCAVFSTNPDEQQRFHQLFADWYQDFSQEPPAETTADYSKPPTWAEKISQDKRVRTGVILVTIIILVIVMWPPKSVNIPLEQQPIEESKSPNPQPIAKADILVPRLPDEPIIVPESFYPPWAQGLINLWCAPIIFWVGWFVLQLHHRYLTLSKHTPEKKNTIKLESLSLKKCSEEIFPRRALGSVLKLWRTYQPFRGRRLNEAETVKLTLQANGYFKPSYKARLLPPEYVLLIDRRHYNDYAAHLAAELRQMLKEEDLFVSSYHYDSDLCYCWPLNSHERHFSLAQLADRHRGHALIAIGEAGSFYRVTNGTAIPRGNDYAWRHRILLTVNSPHDWGSEERQLIKGGFRLEPFTRKGLIRLMKPQVTDIDQCLLAAKCQDHRDAHLPVELRAGAWQWLEERKPGRKRRQEVITALKGYLGQQGYCLLSALAAYPALNWQLTLGLDAQMGFDGDEERELRLRKLAQLP